MEKALVNKSYLVQKFPGKGGWTYALIPEIQPDIKSPFGWVRVAGSIDDFRFKNYKLMPSGNGQLILPIKAEIRKKIRKREGDWVHITLYKDITPIVIPEELLTCLKDEPAALDTFLHYTVDEQAAFIKWIYSAKTEKTKVERIITTIETLLNRTKLSNKNNHNK